MLKIHGQNGYNISCHFSIPAGADHIVIALHGFCGDMESSCIGLLEQNINKMGLGLVRFDWPAHGVSEATGKQLTVSNCLRDLDTVIHKVISDYPEAKLSVFATSFGGYIALLYYSNHRDIFNQVILRSPAIRMYDILTGTLLDDSLKQELKAKRCFTCGFERMMTVPLVFVNELREKDVFAGYENRKLPDVTIIHGDQDDVVPLTDSADFARIHGCRLHVVKGADHRYKNPGELEKVIAISSACLAPLHN